jgi:hypothetical protein
LAGFEEQLRTADKKGEPAEKVATKIAAVLGSASPSARYPVGRGVRALIDLRPLIPSFVFDRVVRRLS